MLVCVLTSRDAARCQHTILDRHSLLLAIESAAQQICTPMQCIHVVILLLDQDVLLHPSAGTGQAHNSASTMPVCPITLHL